MIMAFSVKMWSVIWLSKRKLACPMVLAGKGFGASELCSITEFVQDHAVLRKGILAQ